MQAYDVTFTVRVQANDANEAAMKASKVALEGQLTAVDIKPVGPQVFQD